MVRIELLSNQVRKTLNRSAFVFLPFFILTINLTLFFFSGHAGPNQSSVSAPVFDNIVPASTPEDSLEQKSKFLLENDPVFKEYWNNEETFVYEAVNIDSLADKIPITLIKEGEKFTMNWYGRLTSEYKRRWGRQHHGIDLHITIGDPIYAAFDGIVRYAQYNKSGFGNCVVVRHLNGLETVYGHLNEIKVVPNQYVRSGDLVGLAGNTGRSTGPHLHFETRYKDFSFNPLLFINLNTLDLKDSQLTLKKSDFTFYRYGGDKLHEKYKNGNNAVSQTEWKNTVLDDQEKNNNAGLTADSVQISGQHKTVTAKNELSDPIITKSDSVSKQQVSEVKKETAKKTVVNNTGTEKKEQKKTTVKPAVKPEKKQSKPKVYVIKKGDNLEKISKLTGVPVSKLRSMNKIKDDKALRPGQQLKL